MPMRDPIYPTREPITSDHPGVPRANEERELPERATPSALGHIPDERESNPRLNQAAENVGRALGSAVSGVRGIPERLDEGKQRFTVIRGGATSNAKARVNEAVDQVRDKSEELVDKAKETGEKLAAQARVKGEELKEQAQVRLQQVRARAEHIARHDPLRMIGAAAVFGVVLGFVLRIWRDHHAS
jgi:ElaB/YqjD/DUF883 family membrane-anchored ribosome-binding protein